MNFFASSIRGFFEILMPGIFLLLNFIAACVLLTSATSPDLIPIIKKALHYLESPGSVLFLVAFGYPVGISLRLLRCEGVDKLSAKYIKLLKMADPNALYLTESFFFPEWMLQKCKTGLPAEAKRFCEKYWGKQLSESEVPNTHAFNLYKVMIAKNDPQSGNEVYAAEALSRFVAGSFYALLISIFMMAVSLFSLLRLTSAPTLILPLVITCSYFALIHVILSRYRLLRCKEVDTVFNAALANREHFGKIFPSTCNPGPRDNPTST